MNEVYYRSRRCGVELFDQDAVTLAQSLLGKILVRESDALSGRKVLCGRIVETESYIGTEDRASHSFGGRKTERNSAMFEKPGTAYVYRIYGMYNCFNIVSQGDAAAILIRSIQPLDGMELMAEHRLNFNASRNRRLKKLKLTQLCNGPSKLCMALDITKQTFNLTDLTVSNDLYIAQDDTFDPSSIVTVECPRIGVDGCGEEWAKKHLRFYDNNLVQWVSVKFKGTKA